MSRRACLGALASVGSLSVVNTAAAQESCAADLDPEEPAEPVEPMDDESGEDADEEWNYGTVVDIVEAGADDTGSESILPVLDEVRDDDTLVRFPPGEYYIDGTFRFTGFENFGMVGEDATIVLGSRDNWPGAPYVFKLGTHYSPGGDLRVEGFTVDQTAEYAGGRVFELNADDTLLARDVEYVGAHDSDGNGPMLVGLYGDGTGLVENVSMPDGGVHPSQSRGTGRGGTGIIVSYYHEGSVTIRGCHIGGFPDNGLYCSGENGRVMVEGGRFENSNVANIRLRGDDSYIDGATVVVDEHFAGFGAQRPIRLDVGENMQVRNTEITMTEPNTEAMRVRNPVDSAVIENVSITVEEPDYHGIIVSPNAGPTEIRDTEIDLRSGAGLITQGDSASRVTTSNVTGI